MSLGTKSLSDSNNNTSVPLRFPPPPLAPIRSQRRYMYRPRTTDQDDIPPVPVIAPRSTLPRNRGIITGITAPGSRSSSDSDATSASSVRSAGSIGGGLRPPPPAATRRSFRGSMAPIPGSPTDATETAPEATAILTLSPPPKAAPLSPTPSSPEGDDDDVIPDEHKRVPERIPRSPLSSPILLSLGSMAKRAVRRPVPEPIIVHVPSAARFDTASPVPGPDVKPPPAPPKRKTMWGLGFVEGWWDLGLLERMGTVRRKKTGQA